MLSDTRLSLTMDLAMLEAIKYVKQISKTNVFLGKILQRINKMNAASIIMINENVSFESRFSFTAVNEGITQQEILNLNSKKPGMFGIIPTKMIKRSSEIWNVVLWNFEILGKLYFPNKLKLTDITPVYKRKDPNLGYLLF